MDRYGRNGATRSHLQSVWMALAAVIVCVALSAVLLLAPEVRAEGQQQDGSGAGGGDSTAEVAGGADSSPAAPERASQQAPPVDQASLRETIDQLTQGQGQGELPPERATELQHLRDALAALQNASQTRTEIQNFQELIRTAPEQLAQLRRENEQPLSEIVPEVDTSQSLTELQAELESARAQLESARRLKQLAEQDNLKRTERRQQIPQEIAQLTQQRETIESGLASIGEGDLAPAVREAKQKSLQAQLYATNLALERRRVELQAYDGRTEVLEARQRRADRQITAFGRYVNALQEEVNKRQLREAERRRLEFQRRWGDVASVHPVLQEIYDRNLRLIEEFSSLRNRIDQATSRQRQLESELRRWASEFAQSLALVDNVGLSDEIGLHLRNQRSRLPDEQIHEFALKERQRELGSVQFKKTEFAYEANQLIDLEQEIDSRLRQSDTPVPENLDQQIRTAGRQLLEEQRSLFVRLASDYDAYFDDPLFSMHQTERELVQLIERYRNFIDERVLWIQSAPPFRLFSSDEDGVRVESDVTRTWLATQWFLSPDRWQTSLRLLWKDLQSNWLVVGSSFLLLVVLILLQPRVRRLMDALADKVERPMNDRIAFTFATATLTFARAAPVPLALALVAWRLMLAADADNFTAALSAGVWRVAMLLFAAILIVVLCRPRGLADAHLGWNLDSLRQLRRHLRWLVPTTMPMVFVLAVTSIVGTHYDSLGRIAFVSAMLAVAVFAALVLRPENGVLAAYLSRHENEWFQRLRFVWFGLIVGAPIALAVAALAGYFYTARQLELRMLDTLFLILIVVLVHAVLMRWLQLTQRRLAIEQWRKRRAAKVEAERAEREARLKAAQEQGDQAPPPKAEAPQVQEEPELDVAAVSAQAQRLARSLIAIGMVIGLFLVWADVLPAFGILRQVSVWSYTTDVTEVLPVESPIGTGGVEAGDETASTGSGDGGAVSDGDAGGTGAGDGSAGGVGISGSPLSLLTGGQAGAASGSAVREVTRTVTRPITLADLLVALVVVAVTVAVSKNIPGLLEIAVLSRLPMAPGTRYAWVTIVRYALVIIGSIIAFNTIGISWSSVQWLAAAITVGLGFGLQEIFANFVSGLIILFERPVRVGDTVTVGQVSGTVSQVRMRATTIIDWDRKELIVPNREFVTGHVVNWTLSDPILRVTVRVGVAYAADVTRAKELLLEIARDHPMVRATPEPRALFLGFGDSTLNLELRVFVSHIDNYITMVDLLHSEINRVFRREGIEIAFPQRDLHLRSIEAPISIRDEPTRAMDTAKKHDDNNRRDEGDADDDGTGDGRPQRT